MISIRLLLKELRDRLRLTSHCARTWPHCGHTRSHGNWFSETNFRKLQVYSFQGHNGFCIIFMGWSGVEKEFESVSIFDRTLSFGKLLIKRFCLKKRMGGDVLIDCAFVDLDLLQSVDEYILPPLSLAGSYLPPLFLKRPWRRIEGRRFDLRGQKESCLA